MCLEAFVLVADALTALLAGHGQQNLQIPVSSRLNTSPKYLHGSMALNQQPFPEEMWEAHLFMLQETIRDASSLI